MRIEPIIKYYPVKVQSINSRDAGTDAIKRQSPKEGETFRLFQIKNPITNETTTIGEMELIKAIEKASKALEPENISLEYTRHEETGIMMLKIVNRDTQEIVREIPPEKILDIAAAIWKMAGIIVDQKV